MKELVSRNRFVAGRRLCAAVMLLVTACCQGSVVLADGAPAESGFRSLEGLHQQGFRSLFDGKTLAGWDAKPWHEGHWLARDGVIDSAHLPGLPERGPIGLQHHGDPVQFRNLFVEPLR